MALLWVLFVLYPNPLMLTATLARTIAPTTDPGAVEELARTLPSDANRIRDLVLTKYAPYDYDWNVYSVPWYFASAREVLRDKRGDCESQAILLASLLEAKGIRHQLKMTFDHIWVDFEGKIANHMENDAIAVVERVDGSIQVKVPERFDLKRYLTIQLDARWHPMPLERKLLLFLGLVVICAGDLVLMVAVSWAGSLKGARARVKRPVG